MFKAFFHLLPLLAAFLCVSCSIPSNPPATVTDPALRSLYAEAVAGDGDALYRVSRLYGAGSNGFPRSSWYASVALSDAASANQPQAVYDLAVQGLAGLRRNLSSSYARNASYADWMELEDDLLAVFREVERAGSLGDARAKNTMAALDRDLARYAELTRRERADYVKCRRCNGEGMAWLEAWECAAYLDGPQPRDSQDEVYRECPRCHGKGFVRR